MACTCIYLDFSKVIVKIKRKSHQLFCNTRVLESLCTLSLHVYTSTIKLQGWCLKTMICSLISHRRSNVCRC
jgi:hypothetical protein